jgi:hypothetical protein
MTDKAFPYVANRQSDCGTWMYTFHNLPDDLMWCRFFIDDIEYDVELGALIIAEELLEHGQKKKIKSVDNLQRLVDWLRKNQKKHMVAELSWRIENGQLCLNNKRLQYELYKKGI